MRFRCWHSGVFDGMNIAFSLQLDENTYDFFRENRDLLDVTRGFFSFLEKFCGCWISCWDLDSVDSKSRQRSEGKCSRDM